MPAERITMRQAREIIRLKSTAISAHEISRRLDMPRSTVRATLERAESAGLSWPLPEGMNDDALAEALYAARRSKRGHRRAEEPDWAGVHRELKRKHVTLTILWDEYIAANPGGYSYSRFCELYKSLGRADLLILDDFGLEPLDAGARHDLLEILEERYGRRSTIITSQLPIASWHEVIGDPTYADAILDRLVHNANRIELSGESLRRARAKGAKNALTENQNG